MRALPLALALTAAQASAQVSDLASSRAQGVMLGRVDKAVTAYASAIGISADYVWYCRYKMDLSSSQHAKDGSIPFGVDYHSIATEDELGVVLKAREVFERSYLTLCLADAKRSLNEARAR